MILISGADLRALVPVGDAIAAVRDGFVASADDAVWQPQRLVSPDQGTLAMMAAVDGRLAGDVGAVVKVVSIRPDNRTRGLPTLSAAVLCFERQTGEPSALIDGRALTALRTGAATGVATDLLAAPDASVLALIGTGAQASDQLRAVAAVRPVETVRVAARSYKSARRFTDELTTSEAWAADFELIPVSSPTEAVLGADVVCCATSATAPLFPIAPLKSRVHINAIGAFTSDMCEIDAEILARAELVAIDQRDAALAEAGDLIQAIGQGRLDPGKLVEIGKLLGAPIPSVSGITVFKSVGIAAQDWSVAELAVRRGIDAALPTLSL
jgi:ornithine cyclodeaminase